MVNIRKRNIDTTIEQDIITAFIVSTSFCQVVNKIYKPEYLEIEYGRIIVKWAIDYYKKYKKTAGKNIESIFKIEKENLKEEVADYIELFLIELSDKYEKDENFNVDYLIDKTRNFFRRRALEILFSKGERYISAGRVEEAETLLLKHKQVSKVTSSRFNPYSIEEIRNYDNDNTSNRLIKLPGAAGELFGWLERSWLVAITAPEKRGKTWLLEEIGKMGLINKKKVFSITCEMTKNQKQDREYRRLTALGTEEGYYIYPVFDCFNNQSDDCIVKKRTCNIGLLNSSGEKPRLDGNIKDKIKVLRELKYTPCSFCRGKERYRKRYIPEYWFDYSKVEKITNKAIEKKAKQFNRMYGGDNLRVKAFPRFTANCEDIVNELDDLEYSEGFIPSILVIDYPDILAPEKGIHSDRGKIDVTWKTLAGIAQSRNILLLVADLSTKESRQKKSIDEMDTSENKLKDAHLDMRIGLNQTPEEKDDMVARLSVLFHRHKFYNKRREVMILQQLGLGQPILDNEWWVK